MVKSKSRKHQKHQNLYKMKGCSKRTRKNHLGGKSGDLNLAYPSNTVPTVPNPFLAYTGKGGNTNSNLSHPENINGANPAYPSTGPPSDGYNWLNPQDIQRGGCGCNLMQGGSKNKSKYSVQPKQILSTNALAGGGCNMSNNGIPYPNGLVGKPWTPEISSWPGVNNVSGDSNYYTNNTYNNDISRQIQSIGANKPFDGMKGGKYNKKGRYTRKQRGGTFSNFFGQDLINLGRQFQFGVGSAYNALAGYPSPVSPLPWKGHLPNTASLATIKATYK